MGAAKAKDGLSINYAGIEGFRVAGSISLGLSPAIRSTHNFVSVCESIRFTDIK